MIDRMRGAPVHPESMSWEKRMVTDDPSTIVPFAGSTILSTVALVLRKTTELSGTCKDYVKNAK